MNSAKVSFGNFGLFSVSCSTVSCNFSFMLLPVASSTLVEREFKPENVEAYSRSQECGLT